jgi:hypothetical protein
MAKIQPPSRILSNTRGPYFRPPSSSQIMRAQVPSSSLSSTRVPQTPVKSLPFDGVNPPDRNSQLYFVTSGDKWCGEHLSTINTNSIAPYPAPSDAFIEPVSTP